jgi:hypothetical protein
MSTPAGSTNSAPTASTAAANPAGTSRRLIAVATGVLAGLVVWFVIHELAGVDLAARTGDTVQSVGWPAVALTSLVAGLAGWGLLAVLGRTRHPRRTWTIIASVVLALSLLGPLGAVDTASKLGLAALHLTVGVSLIVLLRTTAR